MGVRRSIERLRLIECDIKRSIGALSRRIITFVSLLGRIVTNKDALLWLGFQFRLLSFVNMQENNRSKYFWGQISGRYNVCKMVG